MVYAVAEAEMVLVFTVAEKLPAWPVKLLDVATGALSTVMVAVPEGTMPDPALSLPERLMDAVPKEMVCETDRLLNVGVPLFTVRVKF
jgi:hypothetical protein